MIFQKKYQAATRKISFLLFVHMLFSPLVYAHNAGYNVSYKTIGSLNLSSIGFDKEDFPAISEFVPHEPKKDVCLEIHQLSDRDKQEVIYSLFALSDEASTDSPSLVTLVKDLELLVGQGADAAKSVLNKINYTVTTFGHAKLAHMLAHPLADAQKLKHRQNFIKMLVYDPELFEKVAQLLDILKGVENNFFSYWKTEKATQEFLEKRLFFKSDYLKHLNTNPAAMEITTRLCNVGTALIILGPLLGAMAYKYIDGKFITPLDHNTPIDTPYTLYRAFTDSCSYIASSVYPQTYRDFYAKIKDKNMRDGAPEYKAEQWATAKTSLEIGKAAIYGATQTFVTKAAIDEAKLTNKSIRYIHTQLNGVAEMIRCCTQFEKLIEEHADFAQGLECKDNFKTFCDCASGCELRQLIDLLRTNTFQGENSFFSHSGRVLAAHDSMKKNKNCFAQLCLAIGEIDALMSVAKLYKEFEGKRVQYNFASFIASEKPVIELRGFWHPLVDANKVVTNDLTLGSTNVARNALVTGSNTGGKSTMLKSILINMLFAQTLTIVPAQKVVITPCTYLGCYLHVADDISAGNSLFKAEVLRAQAFLESVQGLENNQFGFVVIDELFTGTNSEVGAEAAYKVAEKMTSMPNVVFILATHFPELTSLESSTKGMVKNYKVDVIKKVDGTIIRPFKLEPGISSTSIANEILRTELDSINFNV